MEGEDSLIEMKYKTMICNDSKNEPASYFIVRSPNCNKSYICKPCKRKYDARYAFGLEPLGICEIYTL